MFRKRIATYRKMGYEVEIEPGSRLNDLAKKGSRGQSLSLYEMERREGPGAGSSPIDNPYNHI